MLRQLFFLILITSHCIFAWANQESIPTGLINQISYDKNSESVEIQGKILGHHPTGTPLQFKAYIRGNTAQALAQPIVDGNFVVKLQFSEAIPSGLSEIDLRTRLPDGQEIRLYTSDGRLGLVYNQRILLRHWIFLFLVCATIALTYQPKLQRLGGTLKSVVQEKRKFILLALTLTFVGLTGLGITGSSVRIALDSPVAKAVFATAGSDFKIFKLQYSRGDEWGILTPNVFAQINHDPKFPIINKNLGVDGQNMGILGMTGVPIAQWAAIARPATWGYFFLPPRQAQAWQWQLPFWGCLIALWWLLNLFKPLEAGRNLALSALFCVAPYAAAWSNWPLYFTLFPVLILACTIKLLREVKSGVAVLWGAAIGLAFAAWVLTLYPPWMVAIGTLLFFFGVGWIFDNRKSISFKYPQAIGTFTAIFLAVLILASWWADTSHAVALMQNTVYPGQRTTLTGGSAGGLWVFRGYTNAEAVAFGGNDPWTNQPEISSYLWLPFAIIWMCISGTIKNKENRGAIFGISIFIIFYAVFTFLGIPEWLAKITQWGRVPTNRTDVSLGLGFMLLIGSTIISAPSVSSSRVKNIAVQSCVAFLSIGGGYIAYSVLSKMPPAAFPNNSPVYISAVVIIATVCSWWFIQRKFAAPISLMFIFFLLGSLPFNPITKAPKSVGISSEIRSFVVDDSGKLLRTLLVSGDGMGPHLLAASGLPTVNGVLAYPHTSLWANLGLPNDDWPTVNRYQHLAFKTGAPSNERGYSVSSPFMEWVVVTIDPTKFNFELTGAQRVSAFDGEVAALRKSPQLKEIGHHNGMTWFSVLPKSTTDQ